MFAPPPAAHLTRAEIQARRAALQAKRASAGDAAASRPSLERQGSESPKIESPKVEKKQRRPFSAGKKGIEEIREGENREGWKFSLKKEKKGQESASTSRMTLNSIKSCPPAEQNLPPPPAPSTSSFRGSGAGSVAESAKEEGYGPFSGPELARRLKTPPKRPVRRPDDLLLPPQVATPSGSFVSVLSTDSARIPDSLRSLDSIGSPTPVTPPPAKSPPPAPGPYGTQAGTKLHTMPSPPMLKPPMFSPQQVARVPSPLSPPPIPERSPLREKNAARPSGTSRTKSHGKSNSDELASTETALNTAMAGLNVQSTSPVSPGEQGTTPDPSRAQRTHTTSEAETDLTGLKVILARKSSGSPVSPSSPMRMGQSSSRSGTGNRSSKRYSGETTLAAAKRLSDSARVEKPGLKRSGAAAKRATALISTALMELSAISSEESESDKASPDSSTPSPGQTPKAKQQRRSGETMAMLQTSGFFPTKIGGVLNTRNKKVRLAIPEALNFVNRDLPDTPNSIAPTPTELYYSPKTPLTGRGKRKSGGLAPKRSPLSQISEINTKVNSAPAPEEISPRRLTTIPEFMSLSENSAPPSGAATPVATQIHLRGGSVVTVTPPEMTAWQRSVYLQGPIRLPKPVILPRRNSVASMEPFQDAIDRVYQSALFVPRRRSDDAIVDEICDFFDEFGFDEAIFEGDMLTMEKVDEEDEKPAEVDEMSTDESDRRASGVSEYSTPPDSPRSSKASPVDRVVAKDMIEAFMSKTSSLPPVQTAEALRARGIARLSRQVAKKSAEIGHRSQYAKLGSTELSPRTEKLMILEEEESVLPLMTQPDESVLDAVLEAGHSDEESNVDEIAEFEGDMGGMDWDDVEETDASAPWTASGALGYRRRARNRDGAAKEKKNTVSNLRRLVANASTIL